MRAYMSHRTDAIYAMFTKQRCNLRISKLEPCGLIIYLGAIIYPDSDYRRCHIFGDSHYIMNELLNFTENRA